MWQEFVDAAGLVRGQPGEHVLEVGVRVVSVHSRQLDQAHDGGGHSAACLKLLHGRKDALTREFRVFTAVGTTIEQFIEVVDSYIRWYNEKRIKISLGSLSPIEYRVSLGLVT